MIIGSNAAENHPISFKWITEAQKNGAKLISVDPRFTRTSSKADIYAPMRSGTDIAFIGGLIRYAMDNGFVNEDYVKYYTNALYHVNAGFQGPADAGGGVFSVYDGVTRTYDKATWAYDDKSAPTQDDPTSPTALATAMSDATTVYGQLWKHFGRYDSATVSQITGCPVDVFLEVAQAYCATAATDKTGTIMYAMGTTQHTHGTQNIRSYVILQLLMGNMGLAGGGINALRGESNVQGSTDHCLLFHILPGYLKTPRASNTILGVENKKVSGVDLANTADNEFTTAAGLEVAGVVAGDSLVISNGLNAGTYEITDVDYVTGTITVDATPAITDPGDGTFQVLNNKGIKFNQDEQNPGYLLLSPAEQVEAKNSYLWKWSLQNIEQTGGPFGPVNWWQYTPKYMVSLLKAFWGDNATLANDFCYEYLPKIDDADNYSHITLFEEMNKVTKPIKGLIVMGQNPAVGGPNAKLEREALKNLDWMVVVDLWETETAVFWDEEKAPGVVSVNIDTEVFLLPAASSVEKEGSITNSGRWAQWRYKAVDPPGDAKDDLWILNKLGLKLKELYADAEGIPDGLPIDELNWNYEDPPDVHKVAKEINGYYDADDTVVKNFTKLDYDGSTACGNWLYSGSYALNDKIEKNMMARRDNKDNSDSGIGLFSNFSWCWPVNRRIIYNCASVKPTAPYGPWDEKDMVLKWDPTLKAGAGDWVKDGYDVKDGAGAPNDKGPFIMKPEGVARLFGYGLKDGPFPEHYEPTERPVNVNPLDNSRVDNPIAFYYPDASGEFGQGYDPVGADYYPIVATTYRVSEHWQAGAMTRNLPWLCELMPHVFVEMSKDLAADITVIPTGPIANGDKVKITTARGEMVAYALVTERFQRFYLNGTPVDQVGIPWHWGYCGLSKGDSANILTPHVGDCNTRIPEYKAFLCKIEKV